MITVERVSDDELSMEKWEFVTYMNVSSDTVTVRLHFYGRSERASKRHKFKFEYTNKFVNYNPRSCGMKAEDVFTPCDVFEEACEQIKFTLKV